MKTGLHLKLKMGLAMNTWDNEITWKHQNKITKDKSGKNLPHLEITKVVLVHCDIVKNDYQQDPRVLYTFVQTNLLVAS